MHQEIITWVKFFQGLIYTKFRQVQSEAIEVLTSLIVGHLFGLYNRTKLSLVLGIKKSSGYKHLSHWSLYQWKRLLLVLACQQASEHIVQAESMSEATQSRRRITLSVDDTVQQRDGKVLAYCYQWYSGRFHNYCRTEHPGCHHQDWQGHHSLGGAISSQARKRQYSETPTPGTNAF